MTDKEKIEKLVDYIYKFESDKGCKALFGECVYADDGKWCESHCKLNRHPQKECLRHFLLGE